MNILDLNVFYKVTTRQYLHNNWGYYYKINVVKSGQNTPTSIINISEGNLFDKIDSDRKNSINKQITFKIIIFAEDGANGSRHVILDENIAYSLLP